MGTAIGTVRDNKGAYTCRHPQNRVRGIQSTELLQQFPGLDVDCHGHSCNSEDVLRWHSGLQLFQGLKIQLQEMPNTETSIAFKKIQWNIGRYFKLDIYSLTCIACISICATHVLWVGGSCYISYTPTCSCIIIISRKRDTSCCTKECTLCMRAGTLHKPSPKQKINMIP